MKYHSNNLYNITDLDEKFIELYKKLYGYTKGADFIKELNESLAIKRFITENEKRYVSYEMQDFIDRAILVTNSFWGCTLDKQALTTIHIITLYNRYYNNWKTEEFTHVGFEIIKEYKRKSGTKKAIIGLSEWVNNLFVTNDYVYSKLLNSAKSFLENCQLNSKSWSQLEYCILCYYLVLTKFSLDEKAKEILDQIGEELDRHYLFFGLQKLPQTNKLIIERTREYLKRIYVNNLEEIDEESKKKIVRNVRVVPFNIDYNINYSIKRSLDFKEISNFMNKEIYVDIKNIIGT